MKGLLKMYIANLTLDNTRKYINANYQNVSENDIEMIYYFIKNRWEDILKNDSDCWNDLKKEVNINTYNEAVKLYKKYEHYIREA